VVPYPDNSPDIADFMSIGMPSPYESWESEDYAKALNLLSQLYEADKYALPRMDSEYSGALFKRMVSVGNLSFLTNDSIPNAFKMVKLEQYKEVDTALLAFYIEGVEDSQRFGAEVLECLYFMLYKANASLNIYNDYAAQDTSAKNAIRMEKGLKELRNDLTLKIQLVIDVVGQDFYKYSKEDMMTFANKLYFLFPDIQDEQIKAYTQTSISLLANRHPNERMKAIFNDMKASF